jgi:hypothetical protein
MTTNKPEGYYGLTPPSQDSKIVKVVNEGYALSTSTSFAEAIVSVTNTTSLSELYELRAEFNGLEMPILKTVADGAATWTVKPGSKLTPQAVKTMALATYQDREGTETKRHQTKIEVLKIVGAILLLVLGIVLGKYFK